MSNKSLNVRVPSRMLASIFVATMALQAQAQQQPDAGSLLLQVEPAHTPSLPHLIAPDDADVARHRAAARGPTIQVKHFYFEGNQRYTSAELEPIVAGYLNRPISLADLEDAATLVAQYYRTQGWLARVLVPPQQVDQGKVMLKVVEAKMGETRFTADTPQDSLSISPEELRQWVGSSQPKGESLNLPRLERGLLLTRDLPGLNVTGSETPGQGEGVTDVLLHANNTSSLLGDVTLDNYGTTDTGRSRLTSHVSWNNWFGIGDQYLVFAQATKATSFGYLSASVPIGHQGVRLGANISTSRYRINNSQFSALRPEGSSSTASLNLNYPLVRRATFNVYLSSSLDFKHFINETVNGVNSDYNIYNTSFKVEMNFFDRLGAGAVNTASLSVIDGRADLSDSPSQASDAASLNTQGAFNVLRYRFSRSQAMSQNFTLVGVLTGQLASKNLDTAEKLYGGGPNAVRAYAQNTAGASQGVVFNLDARWRLDLCDCEASIFYDRMNARANISNRNTNPAVPNVYVLEGAGLGLTGNFYEHWHFALTVANRLGEDPTLLAGQNNASNRTQGWVSLSYSF